MNTNDDIKVGDFVNINNSPQYTARWIKEYKIYQPFKVVAVNERIYCIEFTKYQHEYLKKFLANPDSYFENIPHEYFTKNTKSKFETFYDAEI